MSRSLIAAALIITLLLVSCGAENGTGVQSPAIDPAVLDLGRQVYQANCSACHATADDTVIVGPSMLGIADRAGKIVEGMSAYDYLKESILDPSAFLNEGFLDVMPPTYAQSLTPEEIDAVIQYLLTLE